MSDYIDELRKIVDDLTPCDQECENEPAMYRWRGGEHRWDCATKKRTFGMTVASAVAAAVEARAMVCEKCEGSKEVNGNPVDHGAYISLSLIPCPDCAGRGVAFGGG